jgi:hypothetical protein
VDGDVCVGGHQQQNFVNFIVMAKGTLFMAKSTQKKVGKNA